MRALFGIKATKNTFVVLVQMGFVTAMTLIVSGSTASFITHEYAKTVGCPLKPTPKVKVVVANGINYGLNLFPELPI